MDPRLIDLLRADLDAAEYRDASVRALLGVEADDARLRGVFTPARRILAARGLGALGTLVRVFLLAESCTDSELNTALPDLGADGAERLGLLARAAGDTGSTDSTGELRAALSLNPVRIAEDPRLASPIDWWIISDLDDQLRRGPARPDHVMGVGGATRSLITQLPSEDQPRSLDLGTGCGIVALHLALRGPVVATDISARALEFAEANARLNRTAHGAMHSIDFRQGDLFGPLAGECFALIASNPPFVVTPRGDDGGARYEYRDGGMVGDALAERVVREAPRHLLEDGTLICLVNWESHWGSDGLERVRRWIATSAEQLPDSRLAAWVIERDRVSPERYAETWARDGGARVGDVAFEDLMQAWLDDFAARRITSLVAPAAS
ncbi:MAG: class I SAM-dependent methyltransferase, partial [Actinobacteria bacterium]|nr:class I SAM-dependent methyltransferase [Actinomycetota bacterium]